MSAARPANRPPRRRDARAERVTREVHRKSERMRKGRAARRRGLIFGLGFIGVIGWSVAIPILLGVALGLWLDRTAPAAFSWTLSMLAVGVTVGAVNAWMWAQRYGREDEEWDRTTERDTRDDE